MNKLFRLAAYAAVAVGLMACDGSALERNHIVVRDELSGCQYVIDSFLSRASVKPRLDSSGKPMCGKP